MANKERLIELGEFLALPVAEQHRQLKTNPDIILSLIKWLAGTSGLAYKAKEIMEEVKSNG